MLSSFLRTAWARALALLLGYSAWVTLFKLIALTLITYFLMAARTRFHEISDVYAAQEILLAALGAVSFGACLVQLNPITSTTRMELINLNKLERRFVPGLFQGSLIALILVAVFLLGGMYRFLGVYIQLEEAPLALFGVVLRIAALLGLAYVEEFIFRHKILGGLRRGWGDGAAVVVTGLAYAWLKTLQFDLGWAHLLTLFLVSTVLSARAIEGGDFARGAGLWAGLLIVFHPLLSLPIFGNDVQGLFLIKPSDVIEADSSFNRWLSGGVGGPLASASLQLILALDLLRAWLGQRRANPLPDSSVSRLR